jgi:hypothetical protein
LVVVRAGSFIAPITFPWPTIVLTHNLERKLQAQGFTGYETRPVTIGKVVDIPWERWNADSEEPEIFPAGGEPENYILKRAHSPAVASALPALREVVVPDTPGLQMEGGAFDHSKYSGQDWARGSKWGFTFVSDRLTDWLRKEVPEWIIVEPVTRAA